MKGCIIENEQFTIKAVFSKICDVCNYNWLITNIECYPCDEVIAKKLNNEYCWFEGRELLDLSEKEDFQWIWGVFSAFPKTVSIEKILKYELPYADGNIGFWNNPIELQHPLAVSEIIAWDGYIILVLSKNSELVNSIIRNTINAQDLTEYNNSK